MNEHHIDFISREINVQLHQVQATARLLEEGATVPFIARYRKEATGSLDETLIAAVRDRLAQLEILDKRRAAVLTSLKDQGKLTGELENRILQAETLAVIEDIYLPFRPKRRTRAAMARQRGLEPLAFLLFEQDPAIDPFVEAGSFINPEKDISSAEDALAGARDIIAEWMNENTDARAKLRSLFVNRGLLQFRVSPGKEAESVKYRDYY